MNHLEIKKKNLHITVRVTMMRKMISQVKKIRNKNKIMINNNNKIMTFLKNKVQVKNKKNFIIDRIIPFIFK